MTRTHSATTQVPSPLSSMSQQRRLLLALIGLATVVAVVVGIASRAEAATTTLSGTNNRATLTVAAGDTLVFDANNDTTLNMTGNLIVRGTLIMKPANGSVDHVIRFNGVNEAAFVGGGMDPVASDVGLWVVGGGRIILQGETKPAWSYTYQGSWESTDEVRAAPNTPGNTGTFNRVNGTPGKNALGYSTELLNLTRNVRVEGTTNGYSHVFIRSSSVSTIKNAAFRYMGPDPAVIPGSDDSTGRYGLHIHMNGDWTRGMVVDGLVIRDTKAHAFVPHGSNGVTFRNTIAFNVRGEAYWWDDPAGGVTNESDDIVFDRTIAARVNMASGGNNHRLTGYYLGAGENPSVVNSVAVGVQQQNGADRSGFLWPEDSQGTWNFRNNRAHNNGGNGIFVWQNNELPHVIDGFAAYYNGQSGVNHGAYTNSYVYKNLTLVGNSEAITSHALGEPGDDGFTDTQIWSHIKTNGGVLRIEEHARPPETPVRFVDCDLGTVDVNDQGAERSVYDFIRCGLEPSDFDLSQANPNSVFRVQRNNGSAYRLTGTGSVTTIAAFYNGTVPGTPGAGPGEFTDTANSVFKDAIDWLYAQGITQGCNPPANNLFCPNDRVTRGQMATFMTRALSLPLYNGPDRFNDDNGHMFENAIERFAQAGITVGCNPPSNNRFCPDRFVTRGEMAAFLGRAFRYTDAGRGNYFVDDNGSIFENAIDRLRVAGVTLGCNPPTNNRFCPDDYVTRGQMAAFLKRALTSGASADAGTSALIARSDSGSSATVAVRQVAAGKNEDLASPTIWCSMAS